MSNKPKSKDYFTKDETAQANRSMFGLNYVPKIPNVWVFSLDHPSMGYVKEGLSTKEEKEEIPVRQRLITWVQANYEDLLTKKQIKYVQDYMDGKSKEYTFQTRWYYRTSIQKRLMTAYFKTEDIKYYRRLDNDLEKLNILRKLRRKSANNADFTYCILDNIDTNYINDLIYSSKLSEKTKKHLQYARITRDLDNAFIPKADVLNEIYEIIIKEIDITKQNIISHK